jgi:hypothetical protein
VTAGGGAFDHSMPSGAMFSFTFAKAGNFAYHCTIHPTMLWSNAPRAPACRISRAFTRSWVDPPREEQGGNREEDQEEERHGRDRQSCSSALDSSLAFGDTTHPCGASAINGEILATGMFGH